MINLTLTKEEAVLVEYSLRDIISCTIGAIYDGDPDDRPGLERDIEVLREVIVRLMKDLNRH